MAQLLLPQCAPPESLHQLASIRHRLCLHRPRKAARATHHHGATESSTKAHATDHFKVPSTEPCCNLMSPLVMTPRKPVRRPSRLRVRKGREDAKTDTPTDMDAAEWISRVLANNGVVEVDPVTMAEQMNHYHAKYEPDSSNTHNHTTNLTSSSEVSDSYFPPRIPGFPRVPLGVALAAGSAVALAIVAVLIQTLNRQRDETTSNQSDSEGKNLSSDFKGEPLTPSHSSRTGSQSPPHQTRNNKLPAEVLASAAGAAILSPYDLQPGRNMPSPPTLSKPGGSSGKKPEQQRKYASVTPFFASDRSSVTYSRPSPDPTSKWQEEKYKSVPPFFPSDRLAATTTNTVTPFFPDEQQGASKTENGTSSSKPVTPFFADEQGSKWKNKSYSENVTPFFADEQGSNRKNYKSSFENVTPFFADEQGSKRESGSSSYQSVTPFFADEQGSNRKNYKSSFENVTPFFADEQGSNQKNGSSLSKNVTPFFAHEQRKNGSSSWENVTPFFADEQGRSNNSAGVSQSEGVKFDLENVKPFFSDDQVGRASNSGAQRDSLADSASKLPEMAGNSQGQHKEFMDGTTEERLAAIMSDAAAFKSEEAPAMGVEAAREFSPEELALLAEMKAEEERRYAKMQALQAAFPALAIGAGAVGALVGVDGAFEMVGLTATASFVSYELLWAQKRKELLDEMSRITDHHKLFRFLQKRKIVKDDC